MQSIFKKFYLVFFIMILALIILLGVQYHSIQTTYETEMLESNEKNLAAMAFEINDWLDNQKRVIETAASFITFHQWTEELTLGYFEVLLDENKSFSSIYLGTEENMMINASGYIPPADFDLRDRPWYVKASASDKTVLTDFFENASKDDQIITVARAVYKPDGSIFGVVGGDISSLTIHDTIQKYQFGSIQNSIIVNKDKQIQMIVSKSENEEINQELKAQIVQYIESDTLSDTMEIKRIEQFGPDAYICQTPIEGTDWHIYSLIKAVNIEAFKDLLKQGLLFLAVLVVFFLLAMKQVLKRNAGDLPETDENDRGAIDQQDHSGVDKRENFELAEEPSTLCEFELKALI